MLSKKTTTFSLSTLFVINIIIGADIYAPQPFKEIMDDQISINWEPNPVSSIQNRAHVVFVDAAGTYCLQISPELIGGISVHEVSEMENGTATYGEVLRSMFQLLDLNISSLDTDPLTETYTIHPELASYFAIDYDGGELVITDKSSFYHTEQDNSAYLVFTLEGTSSTTKLRASSRYEYDSLSESYVLDNTWEDHWVVLGEDQTVILTAVVSEATEWTVADARELIEIGVDAGDDFNPGSTSWQSNSFAAYPTNANTGELSAWDYYESPLKTSQFYNNVDDDYQNQLGHSVSASAHASSVLDVINQNLLDLGESMRYSKETYVTFREALLNNDFSSIDLYNSVHGERTVEHVYFTSSFDDDGEYHPFMVIATHNAPSGPQFLIDVARPPGDGTAGLSYDEQTVTRNAVLEQKLVKIPIRDYGLITNLTENDLSEYNSLALDEGISESGWTVDNYTSTSSTGIAVDGVIIYPASNNVLIYASLAAEITSTGIHVGRGMGFHYHADGHAFNGNGINLYNSSDYVGRAHPPLIAFVFDGIAIYGTYGEDQNTMDGASEDLDDYGGHDHDDYGYHQHAFSKECEQQNGPNSYTFTQNFLQRGAFRGLINDVPGFLNNNTNQFMDNDLKQYVGGSGTSQLFIKTKKGLFPNQITVSQNYPNPFNPTTEIQYNLKNNEYISINITDIKGSHIKQLEKSNKEAGEHFIQWNGTNDLGSYVSAGVYFFTIETESEYQARKMVLLK